jgi:hypothetical protein
MSVLDNPMIIYAALTFLVAGLGFSWMVYVCMKEGKDPKPREVENS